MPVPHEAPPSGQDDAVLTGDADLLAHRPLFRAGDLALVNAYLVGALAPHQLTYATRDRRLDFRHRGASLGAITLNALQYGGDVVVDAPNFPDYLLQFMLGGSCRVQQEGRSYDMQPDSVAVINACRTFRKSWSVGGRQLMIRIERGLLERELLAWTGRDQKRPIEFDQTRVLTISRVGAVAHVARMLCDSLRDGSALNHPLVRHRAVATLASALLIGLPHNHSAALEAEEATIAPASVRRAERFMEENAVEAIGLAEIACAAGVSGRALQMAFHRFRDTTPMAHLRALRLELARRELARIGEDGGTVTSVAHAHGFASPGRFAVEYKARFHESPSETLRRGRIGPR
jgi:AraC-like DNA-binding protein